MDSGVASINDQVKDASSFTYKLREVRYDTDVPDGVFAIANMESGR